MKIKAYQEGGPMPAAPEQGAPAQGGAEEQLAQLAQQLVEMLMQQIGDPQAVMMVLQMAAEMLQGAAQQPVGAAPEEGQAFMRKGGKLMKCGAKMKSKKACGSAKLSK